MKANHPSPERRDAAAPHPPGWVGHAHPAKAHPVREAHGHASGLSALHDAWVSDPKLHGGAPVFAGTAVPLATLLEYRRAGSPLYEFLIDFPTVRHLHAKRLWTWMSRHSTAEIRAAIVAARSPQRPADHPPRKAAAR
jgi:uncharacterized protein (DUF433 family)